MAEISVADERLEEPTARRPGDFSWPFRIIGAALAAEGDRCVLWLPVFLGSGIALYFTLIIEPALWLGPAIALAAALVAVLLRRSVGWLSAALCVTLAAAGLR